MRLSKKGKATEDGLGRNIIINHLLEEYEEAKMVNTKYGSNKIISSHYTWWNFIPINLFEQFHVIANFFFLLISILYFFGETPIHPFTTIGPLVFVIAISMIKDAYDDFKRHKVDHSFNRIPFIVLTPGPDGTSMIWENRRSEDIHCGDVVVCREGNAFPCDLVLFASSNQSGKVFITTDNLDGELNVKTTNTLSCTQISFSRALHNLMSNNYTNEKIDFPKATLTCENPNENLHSFEGRLTYDGQSVPLALNNVVLRGANLRHTSFAMGVAVYTGADTKLSLNGKPGFRKFSSSASKFNTILLIFMFAMFFLTLLTTLLQFAWRAHPQGTLWYFTYPKLTNWTKVQEYLTLLFIINYLIPISIMVTMELQQLVLALFIVKDPEFYDPVSNERAQVNSTNLADELGQIEFLFSDKTGTLTQNKMVFKSYSLPDDNSVYNVDDDGLSMVRKSKRVSVVHGANEQDLSAPQEIKDAYYFSSSSEEEEVEDQIVDNLELNVNRRRSQFKFRVTKLSKKAEQFWTIGALCHTVEAKISTDQESQKEKIVYNAASPDEKAILEAASKVGLIYAGVDDTVERNGEEFTSHVIRFNKTLLGGQADPSKFQSRRYRMDAVLEFNSVRKRMSVMVQDPDGRCFVYTKGAEVAMLDPRRCGKTTSNAKGDVIHKVTDFALSGLRTLVFGVRELDVDTYNALLKKYNEAQCIVGAARGAAVEEACANIECDMTLVAVSGVEDKLQPGVKRCLKSLLSAGIQIWVLTGDKEETAVQISQATGHFPPGTTIVRLTGGQSVEDVGRAIYVQQEGMNARLEAKRGWFKMTNPFRRCKVEEEEDIVVFSTSTTSSRVNVDVQNDYGRNPVLRWVGGFRRAVANGMRRHRRKNPGGANEPVGLVIDGTTLDYAIHPVLREEFLRLCMNVTTVLCCRMTPLQKAAIVRLVSQGLDGVDGGGRPVTAAVGDGGNDVAMLHEASVGIGIFGNEGRQAVRAADFAIPLFKHLRNLLLVHGHWNYYRISNTANLFYFKNVAFVAVHIYHMFYDGFSGQSLFDSLLYTLYNLTFTAYGPYVFGLFEQHLPASDLIRRPYLYRLMSRSANLRWWYIMLWVLDGWWHGTVVYYVCYYCLGGGQNFSDARFIQSGTSYLAIDFDMFGNACFIYLVVSTSVRLVVFSRFLNLFIIVGLFITGIANLAIMFLYQFVGGMSTKIYLNYMYLGACPAFWLGVPLALAFAILPDVLWRISSDIWWDYQIALSGVKRIKEKRKRLAWRQFVGRYNTDSA